MLSVGVVRPHQLSHVLRFRFCLSRQEPAAGTDSACAAAGKSPFKPADPGFVKGGEVAVCIADQAVGFGETSQVVDCWNGIA